MAKRPLEPVTYWRRRTVSLLSEIKACRLFVHWRNLKQYDFFYGMGFNITTIILEKLTSCDQPLIGGRFRNIYFEKIKQWKNMTRCWTQLDINDHKTHHISSYLQLYNIVYDGSKLLLVQGAFTNSVLATADALRHQGAYKCPDCCWCQDMMSPIAEYDCTV